jgi:hypothetical protein
MTCNILASETEPELYNPEPHKKKKNDAAPQHTWSSKFDTYLLEDFLRLYANMLTDGNTEVLEGEGANVPQLQNLYTEMNILNGFFGFCNTVVNVLKGEGANVPQLQNLYTRDEHFQWIFWILQHRGSRRGRCKCASVAKSIYQRWTFSMGFLDFATRLLMFSKGKVQRCLSCKIYIPEMNIFNGIFGFCNTVVNVLEGESAKVCVCF